MKTDNIKSCKDFANAFIQKLVYITRAYDEIRLIFDRYVQGSLKEKMRKKRTGGDEIQYHIHDTTNLKKHFTKKVFVTHSD